MRSVGKLKKAISIFFYCLNFLSLTRPSNSLSSVSDYLFLTLATNFRVFFHIFWSQNQKLRNLKTISKKIAHPRLSPPPCDFRPMVLGTSRLIGSSGTAVSVLCQSLQYQDLLIFLFKTASLKSVLQLIVLNAHVKISLNSFDWTFIERTFAFASLLQRRWL